MKRLMKAASGKALLTTPTPGREDTEWAPVVGTSTAIEKHYLRLTEPPDPASVRPRPVLKVRPVADTGRSRSRPAAAPAAAVMGRRRRSRP